MTKDQDNDDETDEKNTDTSLCRLRVPPHPLKQPYRDILVQEVASQDAAARRNTTMDNENVTKPPLPSASKRIPICRFHNYRTCHQKDDCPYNHTHCHICLKPGHIALECPQYLDEEQFAIFQATYTLKNTRQEQYDNNHAGKATNIRTKKTVLGQEIKGWNPHFATSDELQLYRCKRHKQWEANKLKELAPGSVIVDVGAHYGDTILTLALWARDELRRNDLRFVAIEPNANKCAWIQRVAEENRLSVVVDGGDNDHDDSDSSTAHSPRLQIIQACVGDCNGDLMVPSGTHKQLIQGNMVYSRLGEKEKSHTDSAIHMITLDSIVEQLMPFGLLHLDVEGWELPALRGATKLLQGCKRQPQSSDNGTVNETETTSHASCWIVAEVLEKRHGASGSDPEKAIAELMDQHNHFVRDEDLVDRERNMVYYCKR